MKAHRTDGVSLTFALIFLAVAAWWLFAQLMHLTLPAVGWLVAAGLIAVGTLGLVGALRSNRSGRRPATAPATEATAPPGTPASDVFDSGPADAPTGTLFDRPTAEPVERPTAELFDRPSAEPFERPTAELFPRPTAELFDGPTQAFGRPATQPAAGEQDENEDDPAPDRSAGDRPRGVGGVESGDKPLARPGDEPLT